MLRCYRFKSNCKKGDKTDTEKKPNTMEVETISVHTEEIEKRCVFCCNNIDDESIEDFSARKTYFNEVLQKCLPEWVSLYNFENYTPYVFKYE